MIQVFKKYIYATIIALFVILGTTIYIQKLSLDTLKSKLSISIANEKAYMSEADNLKNNSIVYQYTIAQLNHTKDSLFKEINDVRKRLDIKDKEISSLQYLLSKSHKVDTIIYTDTIFSSKNVDFDTLIKDNYYSLKLGLKYPSTIIVEPSFISEKYIYTSNKKVTIKPPKKFFLFRWFQKKHIIIEIEVYEKSPYVENKKYREVKIID